MSMNNSLDRMTGEEEIRYMPGRQQGDQVRLRKDSACEISSPAVSYSLCAEENINISLYCSAPRLEPCKHRA